ncbi:hypothetical protein TYRP_018325 [Tyrophagus putrescentiae]|nr:hypothetical protein TYRP_018325 [Tyrophagus putrescentiae]
MASSPMRRWLQRMRAFVACTEAAKSTRARRKLRKYRKMAVESTARNTYSLLGAHLEDSTVDVGDDERPGQLKAIHDDAGIRISADQSANFVKRNNNSNNNKSALVRFFTTKSDQTTIYKVLKSSTATVFSSLQPICGQMCFTSNHSIVCIKKNFFKGSKSTSFY